MTNPGKLILVSLPIGNTQDITARAVEVLKQTSFVAAEDTREVGSLLAKLSIPKPNWISYRDQNHDRIAPQILQLLAEGQDVVLTSDRGTPTISDPGFKLVRAALDAGFVVTATPGPSAVITALSISGLPTDRFSFLGFLPRTAGKQKQILKQFAALPATFIVYESPFRVIALVENILSSLGDIELVAVKELTKLHETVFRGTASSVLSQLRQANTKGEWVVLGRS